MNHFRYVILLSLLTLINSLLVAQSLYQFRGPDRTGIYPGEHLLRKWPAEGPPLLWKATGNGNGFSSPVSNGEFVYVAGEKDSTGYVFAFDNKGVLKWKKETGREWTENFPGPRSTITIVGDLLYYCSSMGKVFCLDAKNGESKWMVDLVKDLHGINVRFGYAESLLVDGEVLFCSPGGPDTNIVALNRFNGSLIWRSKAMGDSAAYCSPVIIRQGGKKILTTLSIHHLLGIDASDGTLLWSQKMDRPGDIHCNIPWFEGNDLYINDRGGNGLLRLSLAAGGDSVTEVWRNFKAGNVQSGFIKLGNYLYGSRYRPARFESIDAATGQVADTLKFGVGSTIFADGMLYCYGEDGAMGLISPDQGKLSLVNSFKIAEGTNEHFAHPSIREGVLYVRHGDVLLAFDIRRMKE